MREGAPPVNAGRRSVRSALAGIAKVPHLYAVTVAIVVVGTGIKIPLAIMRPVGLLSDAALPMMVLVLGMQLERATVPDRPSLVVVAVGLSLVAAPVVSTERAAARSEDRWAAVWHEDRPEVPQYAVRWAAAVRWAIPGST